MANQKVGLLGRKLGMTQVFDSNGAVQGVTVLEVQPNTVLQVKSAGGPDRYTAVQLGTGAKKASRTTRAELGHAKKAGLEAAPRLVQEIRLTEADAKGYAVGGTISVTLFSENDRVDVTGTSKGRGFAGVMKRHNFSGFKRTHGAHEYKRHGGSIAPNTYPAHVFKGKRMGGQHGNARTTLQNIKIVQVMEAEGLVLVKGGVPGPTGGFVRLQRAVKKQLA